MMGEQELAVIEARFAAGHVEQTAHHCNYCGFLVPELVAEVRRLRDLVPWCPRGEGEHLLDDTFSGWCSTCRDTVT